MVTCVVLFAGGIKVHKKHGINNCSIRKFSTDLNSDSRNLQERENDEDHCKTTKEREKREREREREKVFHKR